MPSISDAIQKAAEILRQNGIPEPRREVRSLLALALEKEKTFLFAYPEYQLQPAEEERFREFIRRRSAHEPFQHIAGRQEFFGLDFIVTPDVLIPRPETELLAEAGIEFLQNADQPFFCEVGIGSGCIAVSILKRIEKARAIGLDISAGALQIAAQNALRHDVSRRLELRRSDVFEALEQDLVFDLIISNPPYVPLADLPDLQAEVRDFDPQIALTDGADGLSIIRQIIENSPKYLRPKGRLLLEIGFNQSAKIQPLFNPKIWKSVEFFPDLQGIPRMIRAQLI